MKTTLRATPQAPDFRRKAQLNEGVATECHPSLSHVPQDAWNREPHRRAVPTSKRTDISLNIRPSSMFCSNDCYFRERS